MNKPFWPFLLLFIVSFISVVTGSSQLRSFSPTDQRKDSVVIPFEYKQSALYQAYTYKVLDSIVFLLLENDSITLSIEGYAHKDEGNDTISKYLSLNRAYVIKTYVLSRGIDSSRILSVTAYGKTRQLYRGTLNMGIGNCRVVIRMNYPPPSKILTDRDGDRILDSLDTCPDAYGELADKGCPDTNAIIVPFEKEQTSLHALTYKVLDSVITVLKVHPTYTLKIEGHAHKSEGNRAVAFKIAGERAEMVKRYLTSRFISSARIDSVENKGTTKRITAGRNPGEITRNARVQIYLNKQ